MARQFARHMSRDRVDISTTGLRLEAYRFRGAAIVRVNERMVTHTTAVEAFPDQVRRAMEKLGENIVVIDFSMVESVSSTLLGALIALDKQLTAEGGGLRLAGVGGNLRQVMATTRLDRKLAIYDSLEAAARGDKPAAKKRKWSLFKR